MGTELAVVVPALNEAENLRGLLPLIQQVLEPMGIATEIVILDGGSEDHTPEVAAECQVRLIRQRGKGYGGAIRTAFEEIDASYILTLDADFSHPPAFIQYLWAMHEEAEIVIASRYAPQGFGAMPFSRKLFSGLLNRVFGAALGMHVYDLSSGFRLYKRAAIEKLSLEYDTYAILQEILTKAYCEGYRVREIPFHYRPRKHGRTHAKLILFAWVYLKALRAMRKRRNSIASADYDTRAFYSRIPLQRWWQRRRYGIILGHVDMYMKILDAGCGSTQILNGAPQITGMDIQLRKLRFMRRPARKLVNGSTFALPFRDQAFDAVISSQVIEHIPEDRRVFEELDRVLKPGGRLVLGTVDYGRPWWPMIERLYALARPDGYAHEHITHYTKDTLEKHLDNLGYTVLACDYILAGEIVLCAEKPRRS